MHSLARHYVRQRDTCGLHFHPYLPNLRLRALFFNHLQRVGPAVVSDDDALVFHRSLGFLPFLCLPSNGCRRARRYCGIEHYPRQLVLYPYRFCRWKRLWIVQGGYRDIHGWPIGCILKKNLCSAARRKPSQPTGIWNTAECPTNEFKLFSVHHAPGHKRRSRTATAIDAMTVDYPKRSFVELITHATAKTAPVEVHIG
jgi:hypothetical protein